MNRVALDLGFIQIYYYSIFIFLGILTGSILIYKEAKRQKLGMEFFFNLVFYTIIIAIIGARLYYILFNLSYYLQNPLEIFEIWNGGLAIHGAIFSGAIFIYFYTKKYHVNTLKLFDILVVGLIIGQSIGRWGNFFNSEAYGSETTLEALKALPLPSFIIDGMHINGSYYHPTFLGLIILLAIRKYPYLKVGQLTGSYFMWYSFIRFFIEGMREDSLWLGPFRIAQVVSIILFVLGVYLVFFHYRKEPKLSHLYQKESIYE